MSFKRKLLRNQLASSIYGKDTEVAKINKDVKKALKKAPSYEHEEILKERSKKIQLIQLHKYVEDDSRSRRERRINYRYYWKLLQKNRRKIKAS